MSENKTVLVTGASGFIALHCIIQLLQAGYRVRGTLRTPAREAEVRETLQPHVEVGERLSFATADLTRDSGWAEAVAGCDYVLHVASPFPAAPPKDENELIIPARDGALRLLQAAAAAGVKRVVLTSSVAAITGGHQKPADYVFNEDDWSDIESAGIGAYEKSKTMAERAAWDFMAGDAAGGMELAVINPGAVLGPALNQDYSTSAEIVRRVMLANPPMIPDLGFAVVDVRDVASAHITAMTHAAAAGQRFCCVNGFAWFDDIADILRAAYGARGYKIPSRRAPNWLLRIVALFDGTVRTIIPLLGRRWQVSNEKICRDLDWQPRDLKEMTLAMVDSMIKLKII